MLVGGDCAWWASGLPVEVDGCAEGEDAGGDPGEEAGGGAGVVALEREVFFEGVDDRFDSLADEADRRLRAVGFVGAAGADDQRAEFAGGVFEVAAGEAFVAEDELAVQGLALEQGEAGFAFGCVGGDEVEVDDGSVWPQSRTSRIPQKKREWAGL